MCVSNASAHGYSCVSYVLWARKQTSVELVFSRAIFWEVSIHIWKNKWNSTGSYTPKYTSEIKLDSFFLIFVSKLIFCAHTGIQKVSQNLQFMSIGFFSISFFLKDVLIYFHFCTSLSNLHRWPTKSSIMEKNRFFNRSLTMADSDLHWECSISISAFIFQTNLLFNLILNFVKLNRTLWEHQVLKSKVKFVLKSILLLHKLLQ